MSSWSFILLAIFDLALNWTVGEGAEKTRISLYPQPLSFPLTVAHPPLLSFKDVSCNFHRESTKQSLVNISLPVAINFFFD